MLDILLSRLLNLKVAKDRKGLAPNKPLLVLAILDLVEAGLVEAVGLVHRDAQLNLRFRSYSPICSRRRGNAIDLNLPFRHLASDGVYAHVGEEERGSAPRSCAIGSIQGPTLPSGGPTAHRRHLLPAGRTSGLIRCPRHANAVFGRASRGPPRPGGLQGPT